MSEIVLGALIGVFATALGSIITGIINYKQSKSQQGFNAQQARIDRLVKTREKVIIPLREVMSKWMESSKQDQQILARVEVYSKDKDNLHNLEQELKHLDEAWDKATEVTSELAVIQGQISDSILDKMVEDAKKAHWKTAGEIRKLVRFLNEPQNLGTESSRNATEKYDSIISNLRSYLLTINKRIEELLSGDPSN